MLSGTVLDAIPNYSGETFVIDRQLELHLQIHEAVTHGCASCDQIFLTILYEDLITDWDLKKHLETLVVSWESILCGERFKSSQEIEVHQENSLSFLTRNVVNIQQLINLKFHS